jgi:molybdopterin-containing oxidoreductase family iron-sulfur binding subunit
MVFGDLNDPSSKVAALARSGRAKRLLEELGTRPKVFYLERGA